MVLVVVVGAALALTALSLKPRQVENANADKMKQILASVHVVPEAGQIIDTFDSYITDQYIVDANGKKVEGNAFDVNTAEESKKPMSDRIMPVYRCELPDGEGVKYILPVYGAGLWGPIWGYVAVDADGSTIYGAYFAHQGETPGLGAEIEKPAFSDQFDGKHLFKDGKFLPINVIKAGQQPVNGEDCVDGISGGTITSKGVAAMLDNCLTGYTRFLENLSNSSQAQ